SKSKIIWLASENWQLTETTTRGAEEIAESALVLMIESQVVKGFNKYYSALRPGTPNFERNAWLTEMWETRFQCCLRKPCTLFDTPCSPAYRMPSFEQDNKVQFVIDAVYAMAHALDMMSKDECPSMAAAAGASRPLTVPPHLFRRDVQKVCSK